MIVKLNEEGIKQSKRFYSLSICKKIRGTIVPSPSIDQDEYEDPIEGWVWVQWDITNSIVQINQKYITPA